MQRLAAGRFQPPVLDPAMDPVLARTITACMAPDPELRPRDGAAVLRYLDEDTVALPPVSLPSTAVVVPGPGGAARRPAVRFAFAALVALVAFLASRGDPSDPPLPSASPSPAATAVSSLPLLPPTVRCLLDGLRLEPSGPLAEGMTARIATLGGDTLVDRPVRGPAVVLHPPDGVGGPLAWSLTLPDGLLPGFPVLVPVDLHPLVVDPDGGTVGSPGPLTLRVNRRIERLLPLALAPLPDGGCLVASGGVVAILGPPPGLTPRLVRPLPGEDPRFILVHDGSAFLVDAEGRVLGFDLPPP